jgi:hypothetical protein
MKVPDSIDQNVAKLIALINVNTMPIFVDIKPEHYSRPNFCFPNVKRKIDQDGGKLIYGWQLWEYPFLLEAEFHAVWESPSNELIDITPKFPIKTDKILFIPDTKTDYRGSQIDNFRINTHNIDLVDDLIKLKEIRHYILNKGNRANFTGIINLEGKEVDAIGFIQGVEQMLYSNLDNNSPCPCGSTYTHRNCHGPHIKSLLNEFNLMMEKDTNFR